jgi:hypothetical protein
MTTQCALSHLGVPVSVLESGASRGEGVRQDKSRTLLGYQMGRKAKENSLRIKGAWAGITLPRATIRWEYCEPYNLPVGAP